MSLSRKRSLSSSATRTRRSSSARRSCGPRLSTSTTWCAPADAFSGSLSRRGGDEDDEEALRWAALEKLPTYDRVRRAMVPLGDGAEAGAGGGKGLVDVDVHRLDPQQRRALLERLVRVADEDNERFLLKLKDRVDRYGAKPSIARSARS